MLVVWGCTGPDEGPVGPGAADNFGVEADRGDATCDNLLPDACLYPFPSAAFVDPASGQLRIPVVGLPATVVSDTDPRWLDEFVGFGAASPVLFQLPGAVPPTDTVFDPALSLDPDARIVLVDASTGERIPHWIEGDYLSEALDPPLVVVRPAVPLPRGTTVVVGVRGLTDADGAVAPAPEPFANLRDAEATDWLGVHERRAHFEEVVFPVLEAQGLARDELQLAWSFPVRSEADATAPMVGVRDAVLAALPPTGPEVRIDAVISCTGEPTDSPECHPSLRTIVDGTVFVPSVIQAPDELGVRALRLDDDGHPVVEGTEAWPFRVQIPNSAYDGPEPAGVLQYGHGFLGSGREASNSWVRELADRHNLLILSTDLQGMNDADLLVWTEVLLNDLGRFPLLADTAMQGVANQLVQQRMMSTSLAAADVPELLRDDGALAWDPDTIWYHGNSQGGSVGTVMMGVSVDVTRGDLGVPGSGYPLLLHRSSVFDPFAVVLQLAYPEPDSIARFLAVLGTGWDDFDPLTFAPHIHGDPLPGTPDHEVLLHVAKEDRQVHNEASFILGRAAGAVLMTPAVRPVWGLPEQSYPASPGAALVEVDFGLPDDDTPMDPPGEGDSGDSHGWLRKWEPAQDQMVHFLRTGEVIDVCGGVPCVTDGSP
jgi:hypothetical protein